MLGRTARQMIRSHRRSAPIKGIAVICEKYLRAWHNDAFFEFDRNGERFAIQCFAQWAGARPLTIWDVGAHHGEWADAVHSAMPTARVTSCEILPPIAELLAARHRDADWLTIRNIGLSDAAGSVEVTWNKDHDTTNSITPRSSSKWFAGGDLQTITCPVSTIDQLIAEGAPPPDLLKVDVEGHDAFVLDGANQLLGGDRAPRMIQFEYGDTWIPAGRLLYQTSAMLAACGYKIGRLYPHHVEFRDYSYADENFRMGNMIATREPDLLALLSSPR